MLILEDLDFIFRYKREIASYQEQITTMQGNLEKTKTEMTERLHEYQELLAGTVHFSSSYSCYMTHPMKIYCIILISGKIKKP